MTSYRAALPFALISIFAFVPVVLAASITPLVQKECREDYRRYCQEYGLESQALRLCMDKAGRSLSHGCVQALIKAGEVSQADVQRRKQSGR
ncbi:MAG: hypothetical protein WBF11_07655 [Methyloceanibacter sp.]